MNSVHLVIPDLLLPKDISAEVVADMSLPSLLKMLGRGHSEIHESVPLEILLCEMFGIPCRPDAPIAAISAPYDGLAAGFWIRADPVHLNLQRDQLLLNGVQVSSEEAATLCASLNGHFAGQGMEFFVPHPQRWYLQLNTLPHIRTIPMSEVIGGDVRQLLPSGEQAAQWHQVFNEIQMLLHAHPINDAREARGEPTINSVWFWGAGDNENVSLQKPYDNVTSDDALLEMFALSAGIPYSAWTKEWHDEHNYGEQLLVGTG
jgi:2,3-bisphosphoglycerate-independent phosphoglycerate mutase